MNCTDSTSRVHVLVLCDFLTFLFSLDWVTNSYVDKV